jgi:Cu-Zn family superoxide dismutase
VIIPLSMLLLSALQLAFAQPTPDAYALPGDAVFPEGIAIDAEARVLYVGSTTDGTIFRADVDSGEVEVFAAGTQPTAIGMTLDPYGRLWVAGGPTGQVFVYDTASAELLRAYATPAAEATFVNDLVWLDDAVYVTDSFRPELFRIDAGAELGELTSFASFDGSAFAYVDGFNANGIVATPDGSRVVIVQSQTGSLFHVDVETGAVGSVATDAPFPAGDGLIVEDGVLYVVQNAQGRIERRVIADDATMAIAPAGPAITSERFAYPTTAKILDGELFVVNSQFDRQGGTPDLPFEVVRIAIP